MKIGKRVLVLVVISYPERAVPLKYGLEYRIREEPFYSENCLMGE